MESLYITLQNELVDRCCDIRIQYNFERTSTQCKKFLLVLLEVKVSWFTTPNRYLWFQRRKLTITFILTSCAQFSIMPNLGSLELPTKKKKFRDSFIRYFSFVGLMMFWCIQRCWEKSNTPKMSQKNSFLSFFSKNVLIIQIDQSQPFLYYCSIIETK